MQVAIWCMALRHPSKTASELKPNFGALMPGQSFMISALITKPPP